MHVVPEHWRFSVESEELSLCDLSWADALSVFHDAEAGELAAQANSVCVSLEFNSTDAAVLYMGSDKRILRPYQVERSAEDQDLRPFICGCCGIRLGDQYDYISRFLLSRDAGLRLFAAVLSESVLPVSLPTKPPNGPNLPGFEVFEAPRQQRLEWQPLPSGHVSSHR